MIKGFILAGTKEEYNRVLRHMNYKGNDYPMLVDKDQLQGFHEVPPVTVYGTWSRRYMMIYQYLLNENVEIVRVRI